MNFEAYHHNIHGHMLFARFNHLVGSYRFECLHVCWLMQSAATRQPYLVDILKNPYSYTGEMVV